VKKLPDGGRPPARKGRARWPGWSAAKKFGHAPADARDAVRVLMEGGLIAPQNWPVYSAMIGFRNRVVHGYQEVSSERVYEMASNELGDLERFIREIEPVLRE
jgi:uncharacterized protein YutE (UPF0331/DUF86 family)